MNAKDKQRLRDLAGKYAEYACCETMNERREGAQYNSPGHRPG